MWRLRDPKFTFWLLFWIVLIGAVMWGLKKNNEVYNTAQINCQAYAQLDASKAINLEVIKQLPAKEHYVFYCKQGHRILAGKAIHSNNSQVVKFIQKYNIDNEKVCKGNRGLKYVVVGNFANYYVCNTGKNYYAQKTEGLKATCQVLVDHEYSEEIKSEISEVFGADAEYYIKECDQRYL